jgi:hypothetical protein
MCRFGAVVEQDIGTVMMRGVFVTMLVVVRVVVRMRVRMHRAVCMQVRMHVPAAVRRFMPVLMVMLVHGMAIDPRFAGATAAGCAHRLSLRLLPVP